MQQLNYIQIGDQTYQLSANSQSKASYTIPTCIWAGRGCIDLDALKDVDYILIGPSNKRPILWVTSKELKKQTKSISELYQQYLEEGGTPWDQFEDELDWKIRFEAFLSRELNVETGVKYTTENELKPIYKLGSRYYLKQGQSHTAGLVPKNFAFSKMCKQSQNFLDESNFDGWKECLQTEKIWKDLRYKHKKLHKYTTKDIATGEIMTAFKYISCFLTRISKLNINGINHEAQTQEGFINSIKKEFRPTEIIQNPFNRKIGGCLKVIKNSEGKVIELKRINRTPTMLYEKCLKKFLTFDNRGYNMVAIRYHNPISFHYKSPSLISSWKMLYGIGSSNRKRIYCKYPYIANTKRNGVRRPWKDGQMSTRILYSAYRNPFYSGFFTHYDVCAKARIRCVNRLFLFPEWEKLKENGKIKIILPGEYIRPWFDYNNRVRYYEGSYTSPSGNPHGSLSINQGGDPIPITDFVHNNEPPFAYNGTKGNVNNNYVYFGSGKGQMCPGQKYVVLRHLEFNQLIKYLQIEGMRIKFIFK